jgi:hypothetical protein
MNDLATTHSLFDPALETSDPLLADAFARTALQAPADALFEETPALWAAFRRLAHYLSDRPTVEHLGRRILDLAVEAAIGAYFADEPRTGSPIERCLSAMSLTAGHLLSLEIRDGDETWNPVESPPLAEWWRSHPEATTTHQPDRFAALPLRAFRRHVFSRVITLDEARSNGLTPEAALLPL